MSIFEKSVTVAQKVRIATKTQHNLWIQLI